MSIFFVPHFLGKELCQYDWWLKIIVKGLPYWGQGMVAVGLAFFVIAFCTFTMLFIFWLSRGCK